MTMSIMTIVGISIVGTILCVVIKQYKPEYAAAISICTGTLVLLMLLVNFGEIFGFLNELSVIGKLNSEYGEIVGKSLGICVLTQLAGDTCRDCGQTSIASKVELGGKISVLVLCIPIFTALLKTVGKLIDL